MTIKELREQTNMSQSQFASYFGISLRTLQGWEAGKRHPDYVIPMITRIIELEKKVKTLEQK